MKDENYINIQWWMVDRFGLKNAELLIYAIIFGFSQEDNSEFSGSLNYLANWTKCSKKTVIETLKKLVNKNLLIKTEINKNGVKFCSYKTNTFGGEKITPGVVKKLHQGGEKITPNKLEDIYTSTSIDYYVEKKNNKKFVIPTVDEIKAYCKERKNNIDAEVFFDFYQSKGWVVGKSAMKDWKAAVRTWERSRNNTVAKQQKESKPFYQPYEEWIKELEQEESNGGNTWEDIKKQIEG